LSIRVRSCPGVVAIFSRLLRLAAIPLRSRGQWSVVPWSCFAPCYQPSTDDYQLPPSTISHQLTSINDPAKWHHVAPPRLHRKTGRGAATLHLQPHSDRLQTPDSLDVPKPAHFTPFRQPTPDATFLTKKNGAVQGGFGLSKWPPFYLQNPASSFPYPASDFRLWSSDSGLCAGVVAADGGDAPPRHVGVGKAPDAGTAALGPSVTPHFIEVSLAMPSGDPHEQAPGGGGDAQKNRPLPPGSRLQTRPPFRRSCASHSRCLGRPVLERLGLGTWVYRQRADHTVRQFGCGFAPLCNTMTTISAGTNKLRITMSRGCGSNRHTTFRVPVCFRKRRPGPAAAAQTALE